MCEGLGEMWGFQERQLPCPPTPAASGPILRTQVCLGPGRLPQMLREDRLSQGRESQSSPQGSHGDGMWSAGTRYLGDSRGARKPSRARPPASAARPRLGHPPTGSASSPCRRRPLAGRGRGRPCRCRGGCPQPAGSSGTWQPSPAGRGDLGSLGEASGARPGEAPQKAGQGDLMHPLSVLPSRSTISPPGPAQPCNPSCQIPHCVKGDRLRDFWIWSVFLSTYYETGTHLNAHSHLHSTDQDTEAQKGAAAYVRYWS